MFNYERFEELRKVKGVTKTYMASKLNRNSVIFQDWKQGKSTPRQDQLRIVADMLGTTSEYLTGETDSKTPAPGEESGQTQPMNEREQRIIQIARELDPNRQALLLWMAELVASKDSTHTPQVLAGVPGSYAGVGQAGG